MPKRRRVVKRPTVIPAHTAQGPSADSAYGMLQQAMGDVDGWWTGQGSPPPALQLQRVPQMPAGYDPSASAVGYLGTGQFQISDQYLNGVARLLQDPSLKVRRQALAQMWGLAAHERGHNIGYGHDRGGLMDPNLPSIPGEAYAWAARELPKRKTLRRKGGQ